jgi:DNA-binding HxlR family transcriptional regulator
MKLLSDYEQKVDALRDTIDVIRRRWKPSILWELNWGPKRFSDLQATLPKITAQVLTVELRQLEADGVVVRTAYAEIPARVEYSLGEDGRTLSNGKGGLRHPHSKSAERSLFGELLTDLRRSRAV